jgi:hypothetical protein
MANGWIRLHRQTLESQVFSDPELFRLWCYLLLRASYRPTYFRGTEIQRGQVAFSYRVLSDSLGCSRGKLERAFKKLESMGNITVKAGRDFTVVTICNYDTYQSDEEANRDAGEATDEATDRAASKATGEAVNGAIYKKEIIPQVKNLSMVDADHLRTNLTERQIDEAVWLVRHLVTKLRGGAPVDPRDRSLVVKSAVLAVKRFDANWLHDAITATNSLAKERPFGYLHKCLREGASKRGGNFDQELARLEGKIPSELLDALNDQPEASLRLCAAGEI